MRWRLVAAAPATAEPSAFTSPTVDVGLISRDSFGVVGVTVVPADDWPIQEPGRPGGQGCVRTFVRTYSTCIFAHLSICRLSLTRPLGAIFPLTRRKRSPSIFHPLLAAIECVVTACRSLRFFVYPPDGWRRSRSRYSRYEREAHSRRWQLLQGPSRNRD